MMVLVEYPPSDLTSGYSVELRLDNADLVPACRRFMDGFLGYLRTRGTRLQPGEKVACGSWMLKFMLSESGKLAAWDADYGLASFSEGASFSIDLWDKKYRVCEKYKSSFLDTFANQFIDFHEDVLTLRDIPVVGYRYPTEKSNDGGWWIAPERYDGESEGFVSVRPSHVAHFVEARPDLVEFLGLETGFCIKTLGDPSGETQVWFDQALLDEE
jgi:hypothetical protein